MAAFKPASGAKNVRQPTLKQNGLFRLALQPERRLVELGYVPGQVLGRVPGLPAGWLSTRCYP